MIRLHASLLPGERQGEEGECRIAVNELRIGDDRPQVLTRIGGGKIEIGCRSITCTCRRGTALEDIPGEVEDL
jgi:hypothetical protein